MMHKINKDIIYAILPPENEYSEVFPRAYGLSEFYAWVNFLNNALPKSVILAEGIEIYKKAGYTCETYELKKK